MTYNHILVFYIRFINFFFYHVFFVLKQELRTGVNHHASCNLIGWELPNKCLLLTSLTSCLRVLSQSDCRISGWNHIWSDRMLMGYVTLPMMLQLVWYDSEYRAGKWFQNGRQTVPIFNSQQCIDVGAVTCLQHVFKTFSDMMSKTDPTVKCSYSNSL